MKLNPPIQVRLPPKVQAELERAAVSRGIPVSALIRERLERAEGIEAALNGLRADIALIGARARHAPPPPVPAPAQPAVAATSPKLEGMLGEVLLFLREADPSMSRKAQTNLTKLGLPTWLARR